MGYQDCLAKMVHKAGLVMSPEDAERAISKIDNIIQDMKASGELDVKNTFIDQVTGDQSFGKTAQLIIDQLNHEAKLKEYRAARVIITQNAKSMDYQQLRANGFTPYQSVKKMIQGEFRTRAFATENVIEGIRTKAYSELVDTWNSFGDKFAGFYQDPMKARLLLMEMNHEDSSKVAGSDPEMVRLAKKGAEAWHKTAEGLRQQFNFYGGDIGKRTDYDLPHDIHSQVKVAEVGREAWIQTVMPLLNRAKMTDALGRQLNDAQFKELLSASYDSISTNGLEGSEPGKFKGGTVASRHAQHRTLVFKDADSLINYMHLFSDKSFMDLVSSHVGAMSRDIGVIKDWSSNPYAVFRTLRDVAVKEETLLNPVNADKARQHGVELDMIFDTLTGKTRPVVNRNVAKTFDIARGLNVAGKLGSSMFSSLFGDRVMMQSMAWLNNMDSMQMYRNTLKAMADAGLRDDMRRAGFMPDYMRNALARFGEDMISNNAVDKLGNAVMRISLMNAVNEIPRGAFAMTLADTLGGMIRKFNTLADAHVEDVHVLDNYGITEADWKLWKLAKLEDWGDTGHNMLTPESISQIPDDVIKANFGDINAQMFKTEAIQRMLGIINTEAKNAVIEPGLQDKPLWLQGIGRGTFGGELVRSVWQFKSFPWAQFNRMVDIIASRPDGGKAKWIAGLILMQTMAGAMIQQTREVIAGKDPRNMNPMGENGAKFWGVSFIQGGALGIYGDFLYSFNQTRYGTGPLEIMAGPTLGTGLDFITSSMNAVSKASQGEDTHLLAKYLTIAKGMTPGGNLWYTKAAVDHILFQNLQEMLSPGYLSMMEARTQREYGQDWFWKPGEFTPERPPNLEEAWQQ